MISGTDGAALAGLPFAGLMLVILVTGLSFEGLGVGLRLIVFPLAGFADGAILGAILSVGLGVFFLTGEIFLTSLGAAFFAGLAVGFILGRGGDLRAAARVGLAFIAGLAFFFGAVFLLDLATDTPSPFDTTGG